MAHRHQRHGRRFFLVRYKGFGPSFDEWKREEDVSEQLVREYDELCRLADARDPVIDTAPAPASRKPASAPKRLDRSRNTQARNRDRDERAARHRGQSHAHLGGVLVGFRPHGCGN
jgi:hypothetical protein